MFKGINVYKPKYNRLQPIEMLEEAEEHAETLTACNSFGWLLLLRGLREKKKAESLHDSRIWTECCYTPNAFQTLYKKI